MSSHTHLASILTSASVLICLQACNGYQQLEATSTHTPAISSPSKQPTTDIPTQMPSPTMAGSMVDEDPQFEQFTFLSLAMNGVSHIYVMSSNRSLMQLTSDPWDDITPAVSPDGTQIAYSSRRNGYWDIYIQNLASGETDRLTDTHEYDAAPAWSPDGEYIAFESLVDANLEILIRSATDLTQAAIRLTTDEGVDISPAWSPQGRQIAFISDRSGTSDVWIADLDKAGVQYNINQSSTLFEEHPAWSPDGSHLTWSSKKADGTSIIEIWDAGTNKKTSIFSPAGSWPVWLEVNQLLTTYDSYGDNYLTGYSPEGMLTSPPRAMPGEANGISSGLLPKSVVVDFLGRLHPLKETPNSSSLVSTTSFPSSTLVEIPNSGAMVPKLSSEVVSSFNAMRNSLLSLTGWDVLSHLENAFVSLTTPLEPGMESDWLYTGRAFTLSPNMLQSEWMVIRREEYGSSTYWRIFLRTAAQDGSQGKPIIIHPWDFFTRNGDSLSFETGGSAMDAIPEGYWLDFTSIAAQFGWQRLPADINWRAYFPASNFNKFIYSNGLTWTQAMLQLYPPEALITPTLLLPPTRTPTRTPPGYRSPTPTGTATHHPTTTP